MYFFSPHRFLLYVRDISNHTAIYLNMRFVEKYRILYMVKFSSFYIKNNNNKKARLFLLKSKLVIILPTTIMLQLKEKK